MPVVLARPKMRVFRLSRSTMPSSTKNITAVAKAIRALAMDAVQPANSGHPAHPWAAPTWQCVGAASAVAEGGSRLVS